MRLLERGSGTNEDTIHVQISSLSYDEVRTSVKLKYRALIP